LIPLATKKTRVGRTGPRKKEAEALTINYKEGKGGTPKGGKKKKVAIVPARKGLTSLRRVK